MLAIINKHLKSGDAHLAEAKYVVDCNSDVIPSGSRANFSRKLDNLSHNRAMIVAKSTSPLSRIQLVPSASEFRSNAKGLHDLALKLVDDAHESRIGSVSSTFYSNDEQQSARVARNLLEEGYSFTPMPAHWSYEDVAYDKVTSEQVSTAVGLNPRRERRKTMRA